MSEELIQRNLLKAPEKMGAWNFYNIGATTLKSLKGAKIIPDRDYEEYEAKKPDALIVKKPQVIAAIEYKQPKELRTKKQIESAIAQEIGTACAIGAKIYIVTDGQKTFWINPLTGNEIKLEDGGAIALQFSKDDPECIKLISKALVSIDAENDTIFTSSIVDPLPLAQKVWQDLWAVSGATPENCLYTFVEVFIFKYLSDLGVLTGFYSFNHLLDQYKTNSDNDVIEYYASTVRTEIKKRFPRNEKDGTTIINGTIFVSKDDRAVSGYATVFRKILERFRDFGTLENIDYDFKSKLFETFLKESISRKNWGQFFTPLKVVRSVVKMVDIREGMKICDPACGVGKFLLEPIIHELPRFFKVENGKLMPQISLSGFDKGFDKDEQKTIILAKANMLIYMSGLVREHPDITKQFAKLFNETFLLQTNSILGTLAKPIIDEYDLILTNPPYVMSGSSNLKEEISKQEELKNHFSVSAMGIEGLFMEWIVRALKPGGKAFVVVPDGIMNRSNDKRLRDFILEECNLDAVISLPLNTFFTTNKKTYIMVLTKKMPTTVDGVISKERQTVPVFTYLCSEIGETRDVYRFDIEQNDLDVAADLFNVFKAAGERNEHREDKRCKIVSIEEFYKGSHWSVERWWTLEEKIELGIEERINTVSLEDYVSMINDTASSLIEICNELNEFQQVRMDVSIKKNKRNKIVKVSDVFTVLRGSGKYTKTYAQNHKGNYPLYSGNTVKAFATIDTFDYDVPCISWAIDGLAGYIMCHDSPFSATNHRGILLPKSKDIDIKYAKCVLEPMFRETKKGRIGAKGQNEYTSLPPFMVANAEFEIPIDDNGNFDVVAQKELSELSVQINEFRNDVIGQKDMLENVHLDPASFDNYFEESKPVSLDDDSLFELSIGNRVLKKDFVKPKGDIPVYSANVFDPFVYSNSTNIIDASVDYVIWGIDGNFTFNVMPAGTIFATTDHCGAIKIKNPLIDPYFLAYVLEVNSHKYGFDRGLRASLKNMKTVIIDIPIDDSGNFDIDKQESVAQSLTYLKQLRKEISSKLDVIATQSILL